MERTPQQIEDEFMLTSVSILRHKDHVPQEIIPIHETRLKYAQDFFDRWGVSLEQTLSMSDEEFMYWVGLVIT